MIRPFPAPCDAGRARPARAGVGAGDEGETGHRERVMRSVLPLPSSLELGATRADFTTSHVVGAALSGLPCLGASA